MATIFKRKRKRPIPPGADIITIRGCKYAKWIDDRGRSCREPLAADGKHIEVEDEKWSIRYTDASGRRRWKSGGPDKRTAESIARTIEGREHQYRHGTRNAQMENAAKESARPITHHFDAFRAKMETEHRAAKHILSTMRMIERLCDDQRISNLQQLTEANVTRYTAKLKTEGMTQRTVHAYLTAIKSFTRWCTTTSRLPTDPLVSVKKPSPKRKTERRMLLPDEFPLLRKATITGPDRYGMGGDERALLYETAIVTGLRHGELRSLQVRHLHLDGSKHPHIHLPAEFTKNKRDARQYLLPDLAEKLAAYTETKMPNARVFDLPQHKSVPKMLREDLGAARIAWLAEATKKPKEYKRRERSDFLQPTNHQGQVLDFHSLRHTCGAWAAMGGASPKAIQTLMRHSSIVLTLDTYGHMMPDEGAKTVHHLAAFVSRSA